jgi:hypothetical protein
VETSNVAHGACSFSAARSLYKRLDDGLRGSYALGRTPDGVAPKSASRRSPLISSKPVSG